MDVKKTKRAENIALNNDELTKHEIMVQTWKEAQNAQGIEESDLYEPVKGDAEKHFRKITGERGMIREKQRDGTWLLKNKESKEGGYKSDIILSPEDSRLEKIQEMLTKTFNPEELSPAETRQEALRQNLDPENKSTLLIQTFEEENGDVLGFIEANYQPMRMLDGTTSKDGVVMVGYVVTDPKARGKGVSTELYARLFSDADQVATIRGEKVKFVAGEAVQSVEPVLNKLGRGRVYYKDANGDYHEFKYVQPPLNWNYDTGEVADGADYAAEHFMIGSTDGENRITKEELLGCVTSFYDYLFYNNKAEFKNEEAYQKAKKVVDDLLQKYMKDLENVTSISLMSADERRAYKKTGVKFNEHTDADTITWDEMAEG